MIRRARRITILVPEAVARKFCAIELNRQIAINNLALIYDTGGEHEVIYRINLSEGRGRSRGRVSRSPGHAKV